jgi:hypothetical protein
MSKNKNGTVAVLDAPTLAVADYDSTELDALIADSKGSAIEVEVNVSATPSDEAAKVETLVQTFDTVFANDPLRDEWRAFGEKGRELSDPRDMAPESVAFGAMLYNLQISEKKLTPTSYDRAKVMAKGKTVLSLCGCAESFNRPNEIIGIYVVARLDRSVAGEEGKPRSYIGEQIDAEWFGGNISREVLRVLVRCIERVSGKDENDVFEYKPGMESVSREIIIRLRKNELSVAQVGALIDYHEKRIAQEKDRVARSVMSTEQIKALDAQAIAARKEANLSKLRQLVRNAQQHAVKECGYGQDAFRDFMASQGVIPPSGRPTPRELAESMTPGEARDLVQQLVQIYVTRPDRLHVFKALYATCKAVVDQLKAPQEPVRKTA